MDTTWNRRFSGPLRAERVEHQWCN